MSKFLEIAVSQIGVKEIQGSEHNQTIVSYAAESGFNWINDDETPWCSIFVNWCALKAGLKKSNQLNARSWLEVGVVIGEEDAEPGDVVVYWRESEESWKGHVGIFMGFDKSGQRIFTLGGNQGNQVSITTYPLVRLLGFRRLKASGAFKLAEPVLRKMNTGSEVKKLQDSLRILGCNPGLSDGIFGPKTERALISFQEANGLNATGIYSNDDQLKMIDLLSE